MRMTKNGAAVTRWRRPEQRGVVQFLWAKDMAAKDIHKICFPCMVNTACHVKQSSKTTSFGGTLS